jgi:hypothetical protein
MDFIALDHMIMMSEEEEESQEGQGKLDEELEQDGRVTFSPWSSSDFGLEFDGTLPPTKKRRHGV